MKIIDNLAEILPFFEEWYNNDSHGQNENSYSKELILNKLNKFSDAEFRSYFIKFKEKGGLVQSGGKRSLSEFVRYLEKRANFFSFKKFILAPFQDDFNVSMWFRQITSHKSFGVGTATIYLNRINNKTYAIFNNKTLKALEVLGLNLPSSQNYRNYETIKQIQLELIRQYPILKNLYKVDALFHYIIAEEGGKKIIGKIKKQQPKTVLSLFEKDLEESNVEDLLKDDDYEELLNRLKNTVLSDGKMVTVKSRRISRNTYCLEIIKKLRKHKCQFCGKVINREDGRPYIEACHIKPKADGGNEAPDNILILCPNCHKEFDLGKREKLYHSSEKYVVLVNGKKHKVFFEVLN